MKKLSALILLLAFLPVWAQGRIPIPADQILHKALKALGGKEEIEKVQTRVVSAHVKVNGMAGTYQLWAKTPNKLKTRLDIGIIVQERAFDGEKGWQKQTNIQELIGPDLERLKRNAAFNPLLHHLKDATPMKLRDKEMFQGHQTYVLEFKPANGSPEIFYFDAETFLPVKEVLQVPNKSGKEEPLTIHYADYRNVDHLKLPFSITQTLPNQTLELTVDEYQLNTDLDDSIFKNPMEQYANVPFEISLATIPKSVYLENDGVWEPAATQSTVFYVLLKEKYGRPPDVVSAKLEFYSGKDVVKTTEYTGEALQSVRGLTFTGFANQDEVFDLRHYLSEPVAFKFDKLVYSLTLKNPKGEDIPTKIEIPIGAYSQKTKLIFPLQGKFVIGGGHDFNEPHKGERSQHYAYDILGLGPSYEVAKNDGKANADYYGWGVEVMAPADGTVTYARSDVPDNSQPGLIEREKFMQMPDPVKAFPGNNVIIDHGNGEYSFLAHLQQGSVRVKTGDRVKKGDVVGLLGNSGNSDAPHLHYHLMAGATVFQNDGLPCSFENLQMDMMNDGSIKIVNPKRGIYLTAK